jgi:hypothetical protein
MKWNIVYTSAMNENYNGNETPYHKKWNELYQISAHHGISITHWLARRLTANYKDAASDTLASVTSVTTTLASR